MKRASLKLTTQFATVFFVLALPVLLPAAPFAVTVASANMQMVKGWGVTVNGLDNATARRELLDELGMTVARIYLDHNECNPDGSVAVAAMDGICTQIGDVKGHSLAYILASWSPSYSMKDNHGMTGGNGAGKLLTSKEGVFSDYWINVCRYIQGKGLPLPLAITIQNEPTCDTQTYDGMGFQGQQTRDYTHYYRMVKLVRSKLDAAGFSGIKLLGPDDGSYDTGQTWNTSLGFLGGVGFPAFNDSVLEKAIGGCSSHSYYWGGGIGGMAAWRDGCEHWRKDKWMTEYSDVETTNKNAPTFTFAIESARRFCADMAFVRNNYWLWWSASAGTYPEVLLDGTDYHRLPVYYVLQKIWTHAPPGSYVRRVTSTDPGLVTTNAVSMDAVAFVAGQKMTVVLINFTTSDRFTSVNGLIGARADVYQSTASRNMALIASPLIVGGTIASATLPARSVTVIVTTGA